MNKRCVLTPSTCQHDKEVMKRTRDTQGEGNYFCLLGVVSGGWGEESFQNFHKKRVVFCEADDMGTEEERRQGHSYMKVCHVTGKKHTV